MDILEFNDYRESSRDPSRQRAGSIKRSTQEQYFFIDLIVYDGHALLHGYQALSVR